MKVFVMTWFITLGAFFMNLPKAYADTQTACQPIYGGGQTCTTASPIVLQKTVVNPQTYQDVHDLGTTDIKFTPGQTVTFHLMITNVGTAPINNITITDTLPWILVAPGGQRTMVFHDQALLPNATHTYTITTPIISSNLFTSGQDSICVVNQANAVTNNNQTAEDSSQICVFNPKTFAPPSPNTTTTVPPTGTSPVILGIIFISGLSGIYFYNKSKHYATN